MVASSMNQSPGTSCRASSCWASPRLSTTATPSTDSTAPAAWRPPIVVPNHRRPMSSIQIGMLELTRVTLIGEEVLSARYSRAL